MWRALVHMFNLNWKTCYWCVLDMFLYSTVQPRYVGSYLWSAVNKCVSHREASSYSGSSCCWFDFLVVHSILYFSHAFHATSISGATKSGCGRLFQINTPCYTCNGTPPGPRPQVELHILFLLWHLSKQNLKPLLLLLPLLLHLW